MAEKDASLIAGLDAQARLIAAEFASAECREVAPDIVQPADMFLDRLGENIRQRAYVFTDPDGVELCLRPDLTLPVARLYLARHPEADKPVRYWYRGPAFRYQPVERPGVTREFEQMGVEFFGDHDQVSADAAILHLATAAVTAAGLKRFTLKLGDLDLFRALADALDMPGGWRSKIQNSFWRPQAFRGLLAELSAAPAERHKEIGALLDEFAAAPGDDAETRLMPLLNERGLEAIGLRSVAEIAGRLEALAHDRREPALPAEQVAAIKDYLKISGPPARALDQVKGLAERYGLDMAAALDRFARRIDEAGRRGVGLDQAEFSAEFGRNLEYYTGLVFQIETETRGSAGQIAGGGRYDGLIEAIGAPCAVPAVGLAVNTERLLQATGEAAS
jgi:ATP phosphoribosyltransferase regulatory subunit